MDSGPSASTYIYKAMDRALGVRILEEKAARLSEDTLKSIKDNRTVLWLIRESNSEPGMLAIDYIHWNDKEKKWDNGSIRMAFTNEGWIRASQADRQRARSILKALTAEQVGEHEQSLRDYLAKHIIEMADKTIRHFDVAYRMNPTSDEQTKSQLYSTYTESMISLNPAMKQAITCEITNMIFKEPVVMNKNATVMIGDTEFRLIKGRTYEKDAILDAQIKGNNLKINSHFFYENFALSKCINRLAAPLGKLETLGEDFMSDPVFGDLYDNPMLIPSGHTFNSETLQGMIDSGRTLMCPLTRDPFTQNQIIPNTNLERFLKAWPDYLSRQRNAPADEKSEIGESSKRKPKP